MAGVRIGEERRAEDGFEVAVLRVEGDLDAVGFPVVEARLRAALAGESRLVVLDGARVGYASTAALMLLRRLARAARRRGRYLRIAEPSARFAEVLEVLALDSLPVDASVEAAVARVLGRVP